MEIFQIADVAFGDDCNSQVKEESITELEQSSVELRHGSLLTSDWKPIRGCQKVKHIVVVMGMSVGRP